MRTKRRQGTSRKPQELTPKERAFVAEYLIDKNASRAARAAGYSARTSGVQGFELLSRPRVIEAMAQALQEQQKRTLITADQVLKDIDRIGTKAEGSSEFNAALKAKELLGKHYKLFTEKHEHGGLGGGPIMWAMTKADEAL